MSDKLFTIRNATAEDAPGIARLFQLTYGKSSHPCKDTRHVRGGITSGVSAWLVALDEDRLIACTTLIPNTWNRSWELARAITVPQYRKAGLGTELMQQSVKKACASPCCDVIVGFPRSRTMLHIVSESLTPRMLPVGHDGAINVANGRREYHLVAFTPNPAAEFRHFIPARNSLADTEFVRRNIMRPLGFISERGEYPSMWIAGNGTNDHHLQPFSFRYNPSCPSEAIEITSYNADSAEVGEVAQELISMLDHFDARHVRLVVLVDKNEFIERLVDAGFEVTAYLPAWYRHGNGRYDCVLMARGRFFEEPTDHGVRDVVENFRRGLRGQ